MSQNRKKNHHHHGRLYRIRRWLKYNKKMAVGSGLICLSVICGAVYFFYQDWNAQQRLRVTAGNSVDLKSGYRNITYEGKEYRYNSLITTILYAGVDSFDKLESDVQYSNKERADSISLVIMDKKHGTMTIMAISRDTMTEIRRYSLSGKDMGTYVTHIGYAYSYGDGGEASCENLREAVSNMLGGIPIQEYVVTNQSSMPYINRLVDGVTLTVPNNDLAALYPELQQGAEVTLDDRNIQDYLHYRDTSKEFSNEGRVERQQSYVTAYIGKAQKQVEDDLNGTWEKLQEMEDYLQTSITRNKYIRLANLLGQVTFTEDNYYRPQGENREGELHDEFYYDEEALHKKVIELFYEEI